MVQLPGGNEKHLVFPDHIFPVSDLQPVALAQRHDDLDLLVPMYRIFFILGIVVEHDTPFFFIFHGFIVAGQMLDHMPLTPLHNSVYHMKCFL